ncbi:MAG: transcriptional regulator [Flammeovirgaceae bacterium]|nr:transcriptional regulator [Flammeovirgaceae bacterium]
MKNIFTRLNKAFENRIRLGVMSILVINDSVDFNFLKETLQVSDGNLASHLSNLEKLQFIEVRKQFIGKKPNTSYIASNAGKQAFQKHIDALEEIIKGKK